MNPKDNPNIYGTRAWAKQKFHDQWQAKIDARARAPYASKPNPPPRVQQSPRFDAPSISGPRTNSPGEPSPSQRRGPSQRSGTSPKTAITIVGVIVGLIGVAFASSHGVTSTLGLGCAFGFSAAAVVVFLEKLTKS